MQYLRFVRNALVILIVAHDAKALYRKTLANLPWNELQYHYYQLNFSRTSYQIYTLPIDLTVIWQRKSCKFTQF